MTNKIATLKNNLDSIKAYDEKLDGIEKNQDDLSIDDKQQEQYDELWDTYYTLRGNLLTDSITILSELINSSKKEAYKLLVTDNDKIIRILERWGN